MVIKNLSPTVIINGEKLSASELADLNRGREYLRGIAAKHNVTIYDTIEGATHKCIDLINSGS